MSAIVTETKLNINQLAKLVTEQITLLDKAKIIEEHEAKRKKSAENGDWRNILNYLDTYDCIRLLRDPSKYEENNKTEEQCIEIANNVAKSLGSCKLTNSEKFERLIAALKLLDTSTGELVHFRNDDTMYLGDMLHKGRESFEAYKIKLVTAEFINKTNEDILKLQQHFAALDDKISVLAEMIDHKNAATAPGEEEKNNSA